MGRFGKRNHISLNVTDVNTILLGLPKIGKSTICKEIAEKEVGKDGYMFLEFYHENGSRYIEDIVAEDVPDWETFEEIVSDIEDNKSEYPDLKVIYWDTLDNAIMIAEQESIRLYNNECRKQGKMDKITDSINAAWGGFNHGQDKAMELLDDMKFRLESVGVKVQLIGHVKVTNITDPITNETYQQITSDVTQKYFNHFKKQFDLIAIAYIDRELKTEKTGKKNPVTKKEETRNVVTNEVRKIKFRDPLFAVDSGGRLSEIVDEIEFNADAFINAVKNALTTAVEKAGVSLEDRAKEDEQRAAEREKQIAEAEKKHNEEKELQDILTQIKEYVANNRKDNMDAVKKLVEKARELGYENPVEIDVLSDAKKILKLCK